MKKRDFLSAKLEAIANSGCLRDDMRISLLALCDVAAGLVARVKELESQIAKAQSDPGVFVSQAMERYIRLEKTWLSKQRSQAILASRRDITCRIELANRLKYYKSDVRWAEYIKRESLVMGAK